MAVHSFDVAINKAARTFLDTLVESLDAQVVFIYGPLIDPFIPAVRDLLEAERRVDERRRLAVVLNTPGGTAEAAEKIAGIMRHLYEAVEFVVPLMAMSAGTILCMSGDKIHMDYASSLGPIDPQVHSGNDLIPASGYLDKVTELIEKSAANTISPAELLLLQQQDLGRLMAYENAKSLTVDLLEKWLVEYKFRDWTTHRTNESKKGQPVTRAEKEERAREIAEWLGNNSYWKSHGRYIGIERLRNMRLEIEDYSDQPELARAVRGYHDILVEVAETRAQAPIFLHGRAGTSDVTD